MVKPKFSSNKGFTLIELLVSISIVAVLVSLGTVAYSSAQASSRDTKRKSDLQDIKKALYFHKTDHGSFYPYDWSASVADPTWGATGTAPLSLYNAFVVNNKYMKYIPRDPRYSTTSEDYYLNIFTNSFTLSAKLERAPTFNPGCTPHTGRNYCITD